MSKDWYLEILMDTTPTDICVITKTWLNSSDKCSIWKKWTILNADKWSLITADRNFRWGWGLAIVYNKFKFKVDQIRHTINDVIETAIWKIYAKFSTFHIVGIYRSPTSSKQATGNQDFINNFSDLVSDLSLELQNVVYLGDFNIHVNSEICNDAQQFKDTIDILGLQQHVFVPIHNTGNTLDLIMTEYFSTVKIIEVSQGEFLSDHCLIFGKINLAPWKYKTTLIFFFFFLRILISFIFIENNANY